MSLDDLVEDTDEDSETTGLVQFAGVRGGVEKFEKDHLCPSCGGDDTEEVSYYWRCKSDSCDTTTYMNTNYRVTQELLLK